MLKKEIGENAGTIWQLLDKNGQMSYLELKKQTGLSEQELLFAIGWLSREDKIFLFKIENNDWMMQLIY